MSAPVTAYQNHALRTIVAVRPLPLPSAPLLCSHHSLTSLLQELMFLQETNMITDAQMHQIFALLPSMSAGITAFPIPSATPLPGAHSATPAVPHNIYSPPPVSATPAHERAIGAVPGPAQHNHTPVAHAPVNHTPVSHSPVTHAPSAPPAYQEKQPHVVCEVIAKWDFNGTMDDDCRFKEYDIIEVTEKVQEDWWKGRVTRVVDTDGVELQQTSEVGLFPSNYVKELKGLGNNSPERLAVLQKERREREERERRNLGYGPGGNMMTDVANGEGSANGEKKESMLGKHGGKIGKKLGNGRFILAAVVDPGAEANMWCSSCAFRCRCDIRLEYRQRYYVGLTRLWVFVLHFAGRFQFHLLLVFGSRSVTRETVLSGQLGLMGSSVWYQSG